MGIVGNTAECITNMTVPVGKFFSSWFFDAFLEHEGDKLKSWIMAKSLAECYYWFLYVYGNKLNVPHPHSNFKLHWVFFATIKTAYLCLCEQVEKSISGPF